MAQKKITDLTLRSSVDDTVNLPADDTIQSYRVTAAQFWTYILSKLTTIGLLPPAGSLMPFAGTAAPTGYLLCYGQAVSRTTYSALFSVVATTYGSGDGSTTFNLPDLRGRAIAGLDNMGGSAASRLTTIGSGTTLGGAGGTETHQLTSTEMPSHTHVQNAHVHGLTGKVGSSVNNTQPQVSGSTNNLGSNVGTINGLTTTTDTATNQSTGGDGAHNNLQPTIVLNYIIKT